MSDKKVFKISRLAYFDLRKRLEDENRLDCIQGKHPERIVLNDAIFEIDTRQAMPAQFSKELRAKLHAAGW